MKDEAKTKKQLLEELAALRRTLEEERRQASKSLSAWSEEKAGWDRRESMLREMEQLLRSCGVSGEGLSVLQLFGPRLFPGSAGALFTCGDAGGDMETAVAWGADLQSEGVFPREDCWAVRSGRPHRVDDGPSALRCRHMRADSVSGYLDVPVTDAGGTSYLLHLEFPGGTAGDRGVLELAVSLAERAALSLSNLKMREILRAQAIRDPLTGLFNRSYGEEALGKEILRAQRRQGPVGLVIMDLDRFKKFNHVHGHEEGDALLGELGEVIRRQVRGGDISCRWEGDSFIVILPEASLDVARKRAERIREAVRSLVIVTGQQKRPFEAVTASCGVVAYPDHGENAEDLLRMADKGLIQAMQKGGNCVDVAGVVRPPA